MLGKAIQPEIEDLIANGRFDELRDILNDNLEAADIAEIFDDLDDAIKAVAFRLLDTDLALEVFELLEPDSQENLLANLTQGQVTQIINEMSPDDRTLLLTELPGEVSQRLLRSLNPEELRITRALLGYPEDSIGRRMTPEYVAVRPGWTVAQTFDEIRRQAPRAETINVIYVVDERGKLIDDLRIRQLLVADPATVVADICDQNFVSLSATDDQESAIDIFKKYDRDALPVTDSRGVLVGIVTVDDLLDVVEEEQTEDVQKFGGQAALEDTYFDTPIFDLARKRGGWLTALLLSSSLTFLTMSHYDGITALLPFLTFFIPMIISSGGNSGSQAASTLIRGLAVREVELGDWLRVFKRELAMGLMLGLFLGLLVALLLMLAHLAGFRHIVSFGDTGLLLMPVLVMISITGVVMLGTLVGSMLPFIFKRMGFDPAVCSGPFIATFVDVSGIVIYFTFAQWLFHKFLG